MHEEAVTVARSEADGYEIVLRRRVQGQSNVDELIVNGAFAMDSAHVNSEAALGEALGEAPGRVLLGGLGLGFTAESLLRLGVSDLDIVELSAPLISWAEAGLTEPLKRVASDQRVHLRCGDVVSVLLAQPTIPGLFGPWDGICLDIDNGPDFLIHEENARIYTRAGISAALEHLNPGGRLAIWCQGPSKEFWFDLLSVDPSATERLIEVDRSNRRMDYAIYTVHRPTEA